MPIKVTCPNRDCGTVFNVPDAKAGDTVACPRCGASIYVKAKEAAGAQQPPAFQGAGGSGPATPAKGRGSNFVHHPARQQCTNCGAVLGVRDAFCPKCGADIRTGQAVIVQEERKKRNLKPIFIAGGVVVALAVVVVAAVLVLRAQRKEAPAQQPAAQAPAQPQPQQPPAQPQAQAPGQRPGRGAPPEPGAVRGGRGAPPPEEVEGPGVGRMGGRGGPPRGEEPKAPEVEVAKEVLDQLHAQTQKTLDAVQAYREKLNGVLNRQATAAPEDVPALWAELYTFCRDNGLQAEAELCWDWAARRRPAADAVNRTLGRTETFNGVPVTAEQRQFLESLRPRVRFLNYNSDWDDHSLRCEGGSQVPFPQGKATEVSVSPGVVKVEVAPSKALDRPVAVFTVDVPPGTVCTVELRKPATAPLLPFAALSEAYAVSAGTQPREGIQVERDGQGNLLRIGMEGLTAAAPAEGPLQMRLSGGGAELDVVGSLLVGSRFSDTGQQVVCGLASRAARMAVDGNAKTIALRDGVYYTLRADFSDAVWGALGVMQGDFASEWARRRLAARLSDVDLENAAAEARGELLVPAQGQVRRYDEMQRLWHDVEAELALLNKAARTATYLDRARLFAAAGRPASLYLSWPSFRQAMAAAMGGSDAAIRDCLAAIAGPGAETALSRRGAAAAPAAAAPTGAAPVGTAATGAAPMMRRTDQELAPRGAAGGAAASAPRAAESLLAPRPVALTPEQQMYAFMRVLPLLSDEAALQAVSDIWSSLDARARTAAMESLEMIGTPAAVEFLGKLSQESDKPDEVVAALLSLGVIGSPQALKYCETPSILPRVRTACMVARTTAGDAVALAGLPDFLKKTDAEAKASFLDLVCDNLNAPVALVVLSDAASEYSDGASRARIARALAGLGGQAAYAELAQLMKESGEALPDAVALVEPPEGLLLVEAVGRRAAQSKEAAAFLAANGSDAALAYLKAAAGGSVGAVEALLDQGTTRTIEAAAAGSKAATVDLLKKLRDKWYEIDPVTGKAEWRSGVDPAAPRYFLEQVAAGAADPLARVAAAQMVREVGQPVPAEPMLAVVQEASAAPKEAAPAAAAPPRLIVPARFRGAGGVPAAQAFVVAGFEEPVGAPQLPEGLTLDQPAHLYALGLLVAGKAQSVSPKLRELADGAQAAQLRSAIMRALGTLGGDENLQYLRAKAAARKGTYPSLTEFCRELEDRMAALAGLGLAQDSSFLPQMLDMLQEAAPDPSSITGLQLDKERLKAWWQTQLRIGVCAAVAELCRVRPLGALTADTALQDQFAARLLATIQEPAPEVSELAEAATRLQAEAVRAFGRVAAPTAQNKLVVDRLALALEQQKAASGTGAVAGRGPVPPQEMNPLAPALLDATAYMAARSSEPADMLDLLKRELADTALRGEWDRLMKGLAQNATPGYLALVKAEPAEVSADTRRAILASLKERGPSDTLYAQWLATMVVGPVAAARPAAIAAAGPRGIDRAAAEATTEAETSRRTERMAAIEAARTAQLRQDLAMEGSSASKTALDAQAAAAAAAAARPRTPGRSAAPTATGEQTYSRAVVRRWVDWSYSLQPLADEIKNLRQKWALAQQLVETGAQDVLGGLTGEAVGKSEFGAAVAALYAEKRSDERQAVTGRLIEALRAAPTQASALPTLRGVVAALRRLGGDAAAEALYSRLVGPAVQVQQPTAVGVPGGRGAMMGPMAPVEGMLGAGGMGGMMAPVSGDDSGVAVYVARALGSMGREDLLRKALAAQGSQYYQASPAGVQRAVLDGMAYLPAARNPARVLDGLLLRATNEALRSAAADALVTAFRHMGSETGGTGA